MLFSTVTAALLCVATATAAALPLPGKPQTYTPARNLKTLSKLFPQSTLTSPDTLGLDLNVTPGTTGAYATLYDIGTKLNDDKMAKWKIGSISPLALSLSEWAPQHKAGITQGGIDTVYRVETAGGNKPATCKGMPASWEVKYAAQYWVYGPK
ncbi:hypothetical protein AA0116_g9626 [Alternaria tenuissima]|nr:hypothetical protein AA0116_g9626 [Alternaria tenuissima]